MPKTTHPIPALIAIFLSVIGLAACSSGGGDASSGDVVAQVGETSITKADLNHWMSTMAGGDFSEVSAKHTVPAGLVSEPPNYDACVARLEAVAANITTGRPKPTPTQLLSKCRQLYQALRIQALTYLVRAHWLIGLESEVGIKVTDSEVMQLFKEVKAREYPKEGEFQHFLTSTRRSLADELFVTKLNLMSRKFQEKLATGGKQMITRFTEAGRKWTAKTNCHTGYIVQHCKQFTKEPPPTTPPPSVLMEQVAVITGLPCINGPACNP